MTLIFNRRQALAIGAGAMGALALGAPQAWAKNDADEAIKKFTGGKPPTQGKVKLDLPEIAENGNTSGTESNFQMHPRITDPFVT